MTTILYTTEVNGETRGNTVAMFARNMANGASTIKDYATKVEELGFVGLYLPNGKTFWLTFTNNSDESNWRTGFYRIITGSLDRDEMAYILEDKNRLNYSESWHTNGNAHGLTSAYVQAYLNEIGENDGYWAEHSLVKY